MSEPVSGCCSQESDFPVYTSGNGYVCKEITEISGYANVAPPRAGIKKGSGQFPIRSRRQNDGSSLAGTILAGRYKVLETIDVDSFKAHDLTLDQTVTVRKALLTSQRDSNIWRQKARQLVLVRNAKFLNIIDVVSEKSSDFVITESP